MKLKSKDEIILMLIEETEHMWDFMHEDNDGELNLMGGHGCEGKHCCQGRIDILKWVLSIDNVSQYLEKKERKKIQEKMEWTRAQQRLSRNEEEDD